MKKSIDNNHSDGRLSIDASIVEPSLFYATPNGFEIVDNDRGNKYYAFRMRGN